MLCNNTNIICVTVRLRAFLSRPVKLQLFSYHYKGEVSIFFIWMNMISPKKISNNDANAQPTCNICTLIINYSHVI